MWTIISLRVGHTTCPSQCSPADCHSINMLDYGNWPSGWRVQKKTWKQVSFRAYPFVQALALPLSKDKQRKALSTPSDIYAHYGLKDSRRIYTQISPTRGYTLLYIKRKIRRRDIQIHPRERFCCITAVWSFKVAKFDWTDW